MTAPRPLTRRQHALLRFSARHGGRGTHVTAMALLVWEAFGLGLLPYRQELAAAVRHPDAEAAEPTEVRRLRRLRDRRPRRVGDHLPETRGT